MVVDNVEVTEVKAPYARRDKETSKRGINSEQCRRVGQSSPEIGSKSVPDDRNDWSWRNFINSWGQANIGGILDRLILNTQQQIKESEERVADLKQQLAELQQISDEFFQEDSE
ncbi:MAG: hypothetical protein AAF915_15855 [Cyanobacteria bacterium P01_D01_bin.50]